MNKKLWKVADAASYLQLARGSVYHLVSQKRLPYVRISARCIRFDPEVIEAWAAARAEDSSCTDSRRK